MGDQKSKMALEAILSFAGKTEKRAGNTPYCKLSGCQSADLSVSRILEGFGVRSSLPKATSLEGKREGFLGLAFGEGFSVCRWERHI
jgi:hypothetical protein